MDPNLTLVILGFIGIVVPLSTLWIKFVQDNRIAKEAEERSMAKEAQDLLVAKVAEIRAVDMAVKVGQAVEKVEEARVDLAKTASISDGKLDVIHDAVNSRLTEALAMIDALKKLLVSVAPTDKRVRALVKKNG